MYRVQIRSFIKGGNHGQFLQALGLKVLIKKVLPNAEVTHLNYENHFVKELIIQLKTGMLPKLLAFKYYWKKHFVFSNFNYKNDLSVYGSDMIWHLDSDLFPADKIFFGEKDEAPNKISYAPSAGYRSKNEPPWLKGYFEDFKYISVRDFNTQMMVEENSTKNASLVIDPCFHLINSAFSKEFKSLVRKNYISMYAFQFDKISKYFYENLNSGQIDDFVYNLKILGYYPRKKIFKYISSQIEAPLKTLKYIAESKLLITNTFHGVMMALMTQTPFIAVKNSNLSARLDSPISKCFSSDRLIEMKDLKAMDNKLLSKHLSNKDIKMDLISEYTFKSEEWLKSCLKGLGLN